MRAAAEYRAAFFVGTGAQILRTELIGPVYSTPVADPSGTTVFVTAARTLMLENGSGVELSAIGADSGKVS